MFFLCHRASLAVLAASSLAFASACGSSHPAPAPKAPPVAAPPARPHPRAHAHARMVPAAGPAGSRLSADQIWKIAEIINRDEVTQARVAAPRAQHPTVKSYVHHMLLSADRDARVEHVVATRARAVPQNSRITDRLAAEERDELSKLLATPASQIDRAYIDLEVRSQEKALALIDHTLLPQSRDPRLTRQLRTLRVHVATHLAVAKRIQSDLAPPAAAKK